MVSKMNTLEKFEQNQIKKLTEEKSIPDFRAGDTVRVNVRIIEGDKERIQGFEGVCIARSNRGLNSSFTIRKISSGEGVERVFPLYSSRIDEIKLVRKGSVRRAKLYYMRGLAGKAARIKEKVEVSDVAVEKITPEKSEKKVADASEKKKEGKKEAKKEKSSEKKAKK